MRTNWRVVWIIGGILIVLLVILLLIPKRKQISFELLGFPETISVTNGTDYKIDTISMILAYHVFDYYTIDLKIFYLPDAANEGETEFKGIVQQLPFGEHKYLILLNKNLSYDEVLTTLCHEFIHINQYETGRLQIIGKEYFWDGEYGVIDSYDTNRPFEREAFNNQGKIRKKLNAIIYE